MVRGIILLKIFINDKQYRSFIKYAINTCESFSLVFEKDDINRSKYIFQEIYESIYEFIFIENSIGYHPDTGSFFQNVEIIYCECNKYTEALLQSSYSIFDWNGEKMPEELCFYRDDKKWFTCVCHEKYLFIYDEIEDDIEFFKKEKIKYFYTF